MAKYTADQLRQMLAKGQAMKNPTGDASYPIADEEDLQSAIHAVGLGGADSDAIRRYIIGRAKAMGKSSMIPDTWQSDGSLSSPGRSETAPIAYVRSFALEDISVRAGGDGRTVTAYAAIFNQPAHVADRDGEYEEVLDPSCFNRAIEHAQRSGKRFPVLLNHGMTIFHTPDPDGGIPIGVAEEVRADSRGLFTRARYHKTPRADMALEAVREGSITSYSFSGAFRRSDPQVPRGGFRRRSGALPTVRRMESTLREFGPATFPVYSGAEIVGVRTEQVSTVLETLAALGNFPPEERERLIGMVRSGTPLGDPPDVGTSDEEPAAAEADPPVRHSARSPKAELQARRAQFLIRHGGDITDA